MSTLLQCPVCHESNITEILSLSHMPVLSHKLYNSVKKSENTTRGHINLSFCKKCTHIYNNAFDTSLIDYNTTYENALHFSSVFNKYENKLAKYLIQKYDLVDKSIIDLGAGDGHFLITICALGNNRGIGIDNSDVIKTKNSPNISFSNASIEEFEFKEKAHLISCRHVLEHIYDVNLFVQKLHNKLSVDNKDTVLYIEVPNAQYMVENASYFDVLYEHCHYFNTHSLSKLLIKNNFHVESVYTAYNEQFLCLEASLSPIEPTKEFEYDQNLYAKKVNSFGTDFLEQINKYNYAINTFERDNQKIVLWGAGSKGITLLNLLQSNDINYIVDINTRKHQHYVAGTNIRIVSPEFLNTYQPDIVIITNPIYEKEIRDRLEKLSPSSKVLVF